MRFLYDSPNGNLSTREFEGPGQGMVPTEGLAPQHPVGPGIPGLVRLPVPPSGHGEKLSGRRDPMQRKRALAVASVTKRIQGASTISQRVGLSSGQDLTFDARV